MFMSTPAARRTRSLREGAASAWRPSLALIAVLAAGTATACSGSDAKSPDVALLATACASTPAPGTSSTGSNDAHRPRYKLNMTAQELEAIQKPYIKCMTAHGVTDPRDQKFGNTKPTSVSQTTLAAAQQACASTIPLPVWENDPKNPDALDFNRKVVTCLRGKGVAKVEVTTQNGEVSVAFGGKENDQQSITRGMQYYDYCTRQVSQSSPH
jgi:hypothetical protein